MNVDIIVSTMIGLLALVLGSVTSKKIIHAYEEEVKTMAKKYIADLKRENKHEQESTN